MPNTFLYIRVSSTEQAANGFSLMAQYNECLAYANRSGLLPGVPLSDKTNMGMKTPGTFSDPGVSAWKCPLFQRPGFLELWKNVKPGDHIICMTVDRAFRSMLDFCKTWPVIESAGVVLHFVRQQVRMDTAAGQMLMQMHVSFAEYKSALISERVKESYAVRGRKGSEPRTRQKLVVSDRHINRYTPSEPKVVKPTGTVYGYVRVSTHEQDCESQEQIVESIMKRRIDEGYAAGDIFIDEGVSAYKHRFRDRPIGSELWAILKPGDLLVCSRLDRMFRSMPDAAVTIKEFNERGVFLSVTSEITTDTPQGRHAANILISMAELESADISWRAKMGLQVKMQLNGIWLSPHHLPRYMEKIDEGNGTWSYCLKTEVIEDIFLMQDLHKQGFSPKAISQFFADRFSREHGLPEIPTIGLQITRAECKVRREGTRYQIARFFEFIRKHKDQIRNGFIPRPYTDQQVRSMLALIREDGDLRRYIDSHGGDIDTILEYAREKRAISSRV